LAGIILMSVLPTTIASNIAMTRNAGGNTEAATIEVCIGNTLGTFITPLLLTMYLQKKNGWGFIEPKASSGNGLTAIYKHMIEQLGETLFAPLIVGQIVQMIWKDKTKKYRELLRLNYVGQVLLLVLIWSTFCNKFASGAFKVVSHQSIILICFLNVVLYAFWTGVCLLIARLPFLGAPREGEYKWKTWLRNQRFDKGETAAICFCAAAKGLVLGAPLIAILYGGYDNQTQSIMSTPIALYQTTQVLIAQLSVRIFKRWIEQPSSDDPKLDVEDSEKTPSPTEGRTTPVEKSDNVV